MKKKKNNKNHSSKRMPILIFLIIVTISFFLSGYIIGELSKVIPITKESASIHDFEILCIPYFIAYLLMVSGTISFVRIFKKLKPFEEGGLTFEFLATFISGLFVGLFYGFILGLIYQPMYGLVQGFTFGLLWAFIVGLIHGLIKEFE